MHSNKFISNGSSAFSFLALLIWLLPQIACKKYLDVKRQQNQAVPSTLQDLQAVMDNQGINERIPPITEFVSDNHYLTQTVFNTLGIEERMSYLWDAQAIIPVESWERPYAAIYNCNFVLDYLPKVPVSSAQQTQADNLLGTALFARSFMFHGLAQLFCKPYSSTAATDPGIVVRLTSAVGAPSVRATVLETYEQIIGDLKTAVNLLPRIALNKFRPNKAAAYALLARVYLSMRDYENAGLYADQSLGENSFLLDYNALTPAGAPLIPGYLNNPEILFMGTAYYSLLLPTSNRVDTALYTSYNNNDLRKQVFFGANGSAHYWNGSYMPDAVRHIVFTGMAVDEQYLIRAESSAKAGKKEAALNDLNLLLKKRWKSGTFTDLTAADANGALVLVRNERRKELLFRGIRWSDLRRYNLEGANITLKRLMSGNEYTLPPNDPRWLLLIPTQEISQSGIAQNHR